MYKYVLTVCTLLAVVVALFAFMITATFRGRTCYFQHQRTPVLPTGVAHVCTCCRQPSYFFANVPYSYANSDVR